MDGLLGDIEVSPFNLSVGTAVIRGVSLERHNAQEK